MERGIRARAPFHSVKPRLTAPPATVFPWADSGAPPDEAAGAAVAVVGCAVAAARVFAPSVVSAAGAGAPLAAFWRHSLAVAPVAGDPAPVSAAFSRAPVPASGRAFPVVAGTFCRRLRCPCWATRALSARTVRWHGPPYPLAHRNFSPVAAGRNVR